MTSVWFTVGADSDRLPYGGCMTAVELATLEGTAENKIACVTLNRPRRLNAIDGSLIDAMDDALDVLSTGEFRAAILTGAGRGFCAGADLSGDRGGLDPKPRRTAHRSRSAMTPRFGWPICTPGSTSCRSR